MLLLHAQNIRFNFLFHSHTTISKKTVLVDSYGVCDGLQSTHSSRSHIKHNNTVCVKPKPWSKNWSDLGSSTVQRTHTHHLAKHTDSFDSICLYFSCSSSCSSSLVRLTWFAQFSSFLFFCSIHFWLWFRFVYFHTFIPSSCVLRCVLFSSIRIIK